MYSSPTNETPDDRTGRAIIRDEALRLFAEQGADAVTIRQIAAAAAVSPGLVVHHFGSKDALRSAVDRHVLDTFDRVLAELTDAAAEAATSTTASADGSVSADRDPAGTGSMAEAMLAHLPPASPIPAYLRRLLLDGSDAGTELFGRLYEMARATLAAMVAAGAASPGRDPATRAAFLMANDLAVLLLRDRLAGVLGFDPLSKEGMSRWATEVVAIYGGGLRERAATSEENRP
ncbi:MAG: TetR family transcriptional regulator [Actinomycetota bacterium]|nr:TetR family transcriptional regulator [Actinomycetota bacterium]